MSSRSASISRNETCSIWGKKKKTFWKVCPQLYHPTQLSQDWKGMCLSMTAWGQALSKFWDVSLFFDAQPLKLVGEASCCQRTGTHWRPDAYSRLRTKITSYFPKSFSTITPDCSFCNTATACCHNCSPLWDFRFLVKCDWFCTWLPVVSWLQKETLGVPAEQMSCFVGGYLLWNTSVASCSSGANLKRNFLQFAHR